MARKWNKIKRKAVKRLPKVRKKKAGKTCPHGQPQKLTRAQRRKLIDGRKRGYPVDRVCTCCGRKKHITLTYRTWVNRCCYCKPEDFPSGCSSCGWSRKRRRKKRS